MTWEELRGWLLENGWSRHPPPEVHKSPDADAFRLACENGRVLSHPIKHGGTMIVHMLSRNVRISIVHPNGMVQRRMTVSLSHVKMEGGMPRGMMLWTDPHSPHHYRKPTS